jgi:hypothetical protein
LYAQSTGITIGVGASALMLASLAVRLVFNLIHQGAGPIFQAQFGLSPTARAVEVGEESQKKAGS